MGCHFTIKPETKEVHILYEHVMSKIYVGGMSISDA